MWVNMQVTWIRMGWGPGRLEGPKNQQLTSWKIHHEWRCISLISYWKSGFFQCHVSFPGVYIPGSSIRDASFRCFGSAYTTTIPQGFGFFTQPEAAIFFVGKHHEGQNISMIEQRSKRTSSKWRSSHHHKRRESRSSGETLNRQIRELLAGRQWPGHQWLAATNPSVPKKSWLFPRAICFCIHGEGGGGGGIKTIPTNVCSGLVLIPWTTLGTVIECWFISIRSIP